MQGCTSPTLDGRPFTPDTPSRPHSQPLTSNMLRVLHPRTSLETGILGSIFQYSLFGCWLLKESILIFNTLPLNISAHSLTILNFSQRYCKLGLSASSLRAFLSFVAFFRLSPDSFQHEPSVWLLCMSVIQPVKSPLPIVKYFHSWHPLVGLSI